MNILICLDDRDGMLFNQRRQSADAAVCKCIRELTKDRCLRMNAYSSSMFPGDDDLYVGDDFLSQAGADDWCFVEKEDVLPFLDHVKTVVIFRWNRVYPRDTYFPMNELRARWKLVETIEFPGSSHERITQERYER